MLDWILDLPGRLFGFIFRLSFRLFGFAIELFVLVVILFLLFRVIVGILSGLIPL